MAEENMMGGMDASAIKEERKRLKAEQKAQRKEAKKRARELADQEAELEEEGSNIPIFLTTVAIVGIWLLILCVLIKLDVGGFGSGVLKPLLKDVPVVNKILPTEGPLLQDGEEAADEYAGYESLKEAVEQIKLLELQLEQADLKSSTMEDENAKLKEEITRLKTFEASQVEFERIKTEFFEEVIYAEKGPGVEEYQKYYESIDPATAEFLYRQVVAELEEEKDKFERLENEIFQYYIVSDIQLLKECNELVFYSPLLDCYIWGVTHWGTSWDYVLTSLKLREKEND